MKSMLSTVLLSSIVLLASAPAYAISTWTHLTAENIDDQHLSFTIRVKDLEPLREYEVVISHKAGKLSPLVNAHLTVYDGKTQIAACDIKAVRGPVQRKAPVDAARSDYELVYRFQVHPRYLQKSKFVFAEMAYAKRKDEQGNEQIIGMPSGDFYWFYLEQFADVEVSKNAAPPGPGDGTQRLDPRTEGGALLEKVRLLYPDIHLQRGESGEPFFSSISEAARVRLDDGTERLVVRAGITVPAARVDHGRTLLLFFKDPARCIRRVRSSTAPHPAAGRCG